MLINVIIALTSIGNGGGPNESEYGAVPQSDANNELRLELRLLPLQDSVAGRYKVEVRLRNVSTNYVAVNSNFSVKLDGRYRCLTKTGQEVEIIGPGYIGERGLISARTIANLSPGRFFGYDDVLDVGRNLDGGVLWAEIEFRFPKVDWVPDLWSGSLVSNRVQLPTR